MRKKPISSKKQSGLDNLQRFFEERFDSIEKQIQELNHNQKISDQKNADSYKDLRFKIMAEAASTRQDLEEILRAEIQVANSELKNELKKLETRLNKRITKVGDLITIQLGGKIQNHEKRIAQLEHLGQVA